MWFWKVISVLLMAAGLLVFGLGLSWRRNAPAPAATSVRAAAGTFSGQEDEVAPVTAPYIPAAVAPVTAPVAATASGTSRVAERTAAAPSAKPPAAPALPASDPRVPKPTTVPRAWSRLDERVRTTAAGFSGRISVVAVDLTSGERYDFRPNDRYLPASTFKLPVTLCVAEAIHRGELRWDTPVTFTKPDDDTVGQGGFATTAYDTKWPIRNLVDRSLISSNNVAAKMLARTLTWEGLANCTRKMGGTVTRTEDGSSPVTASDEAAWWQHLWKMKQERPAVAEDLLRPLRLVTYKGRIQAGTPEPELVTHKFGTLPPYEHDGAIVWGKRPYILVVMSHGGDHEGMDDTIAQIARAAWDSVYGR